MQVLDGFFIKQAQDIRESVAYLTVMTRYLQSHYRVSTVCLMYTHRVHGHSLSQGKTIKVYPVETVQQLTQQRIEGRGGKEDDSIVCSMPFVAFNEVSVKTKVSSLSTILCTCNVGIYVALIRCAQCHKCLLNNSFKCL